MDETVPEPYDFSFVDAVARIALYDDLRSAPRVTEVKPAPTDQFIENLAATIHEQARSSGGSIPYTVIREVSENFIHAQFTEIVVTILDRGNTIRFADQGPGIPNKEKAQLPGFSSAREPMKQFIRGVGSGLPIVKDYLEYSNGSITIEDNLDRGSVVTLSMNPQFTPQAQPQMQPQAQPYGQQAPYGQPMQPAQGFPQQAYAPQPQAAGFQQGFAPQNGAYGQPQFMQPAQAVQEAPQQDFPHVAAVLAQMNERERSYLKLFSVEGELGVTEIANLTGDANSSIYNALTKMEESGLVEKTPRKKRMITEVGRQIAETL